MNASNPVNGQPAWRVLVVDDLLVWASTISTYATLFDCEVRHATNLSAAMRELARWRPHLVLLDLHMPRDPWEPIPLLRDKYKSDQKSLAFCEQVTSYLQLSEVVLVVTSVEEQQEQQDLALSAGAHQFFTKSEFTVGHFEQLLQYIPAGS